MLSLELYGFFNQHGDRHQRKKILKFSIWWTQSDIPSLTRIPRGASRQMGCVGWAVLLCRMPWNVRYKHYKM